MSPGERVRRVACARPLMTSAFDPSRLTEQPQGSAQSAHEDDGALVARWGLGDEDALRTLHQRYAALVFTVAVRFVDAATAEEVVQDVFVTLWQKHETFDPARGAFRGWIVQIGRRRALNELRRKKGRGQHGDEALSQLSDDSLEPDEAPIAFGRSGRERSSAH